VSDDSEDLVRLRKTMASLIDVIEDDGKARREQTALIEAQTKQLAAFNATLETALGALEQMMPMLEGAAKGSTMLGMGVNILKNVFARRRRPGSSAGPRL
jgi:fumarate hydratase class II